MSARENEVIIPIPSLIERHFGNQFHKKDLIAFRDKTGNNLLGFLIHQPTTSDSIVSVVEYLLKILTRAELHQLLTYRNRKGMTPLCIAVSVLDVLFAKIYQLMGANLRKEVIDYYRHAPYSSSREYTLWFLEHRAESILPTLKDLPKKIIEKMDSLVIDTAVFDSITALTVNTTPHTQEDVIDHHLYHPNQLQHSHFIPLIQAIKQGVSLVALETEISKLISENSSYAHLVLQQAFTLIANNIALYSEMAFIVFKHSFSLKGMQEFYLTLCTVERNTVLHLAASYIDSTWIDMLIQIPEFLNLLPQKNANGLTPLYCAILAGNESAIHKLYSLQIQRQDQNKSLTLEDFIVRSDVQGESLLTVAINTDSTRAVRYLLTQFPKIRQQLQNHPSLLIDVLIDEDFQTSDLLLEINPSYQLLHDFAIIRGEPFLYYLLRKNKETAIRYLAQKLPEAFKNLLKVKNVYGVTLLWNAAVLGNKSMFEFFQQMGACIETEVYRAKNINGNSPLISAAFLGSIEGVKFLMQMPRIKQRLHERNHFNRTALCEAYLKLNVELVELLCETPEQFEREVLSHVEANGRNIIDLMLDLHSVELDPTELSTFHSSEYQKYTHYFFILQLVHDERVANNPSLSGAYLRSFAKKGKYQWVDYLISLRFNASGLLKLKNEIEQCRPSASLTTNPYEEVLKTIHLLELLESDIAKAKPNSAIDLHSYLKKGLSVYLRYDDNNTLLHRALYIPNIGLVRSLLSRDTSLDIENSHHLTVLQLLDRLVAKASIENNAENLKQYALINIIFLCYSVKNLLQTQDFKKCIDSLSQIIQFLKAAPEAFSFIKEDCLLLLDILQENNHPLLDKLTSSLESIIKKHLPNQFLTPTLLSQKTAHLKKDTAEFHHIESMKSHSHFHFFWQFTHYLPGNYSNALPPGTTHSSRSKSKNHPQQARR